MSARPAAPAFPKNTVWVNLAQGPEWERLRGRVLLLHFWNASNVHSQHMLAELRVLEGKYHDGVTVIGVHTPKYDAERSSAVVQKAINRLWVRHAVANDADFVLWRHYGVQSWPTTVVVDSEGRIAGSFPGEGRREELDQLVADLLEEAAARDLRAYDASPSISKPEPRTALRFPGKLLVTESGLFVSDSGNNRVLECTHDGRVIRQIGSGTAGHFDGKLADAGFNDPQGLALIKDMLYIADRGNHCIRRVRMITGEVETVAGTGAHGRPLTQEYSIATDVALNSPWDLAVANEKLFIAMAGQNQIWALDLARNRLLPFSGSGNHGRDDGEGLYATFARPVGLAYGNQTLYVVDSDSSSVRSVRPDGRLQTLVGAGVYEFGDVDGLPAAVRLQGPMGCAVDPNGQILWVVDTYNNKLKALSLRGGGAKTINLPYKFLLPADVKSSPGKIWIANTGAHEVVRIDTASGQAQRLPIGE